MLKRFALAGALVLILSVPTLGCGEGSDCALPWTWRGSNCNPVEIHGSWDAHPVNP